MAQVRQLAQGIAFRATTQYQKDAAGFAIAHPKLILGDPDTKSRLFQVWEELGRPLIDAVEAR